MALKCPSCKSQEIEYYMGAQFGKYQCKNCGYAGGLVLEKTKKRSNKKN